MSVFVTVSKRVCVCVFMCVLARVCLCQCVSLRACVYVGVRDTSIRRYM